MDRARDQCRAAHGHAGIAVTRASHGTFSIDWVETRTPRENVVSYLARYANRVVIANDRLTKIEDGQVFFSYKDYQDDTRRKVYHLPGVVFLAQFPRHTLPSGLHNKRRYGFWGYQVRTKNLARIREQLGVPPVELFWERARAVKIEGGRLSERYIPETG